MFGKFALSFIIFMSFGVDAAQIATVVTEDAPIYLNPDFDANIVATVKRGETYQISNQTQGPFYKIRLKNKQLGWISSVDIKPGVLKLPTSEKKAVEVPSPPLESYSAEQRTFNTFAIQRYQGLYVQKLQWTEKTLGKNRHDELIIILTGTKRIPVRCRTIRRIRTACTAIN